MRRAGASSFNCPKEIVAQRSNWNSSLGVSPKYPFSAISRKTKQKRGGVERKSIKTKINTVVDASAPETIINELLQENTASSEYHPWVPNIWAIGGQSELLGERFIPRFMCVCIWP